MAPVPVTSRSSPSPLLLRAVFFCALFFLALFLLPDAALTVEEGRCPGCPPRDLPGGRPASASPGRPCLLAADRPAPEAPATSPGTAPAPAGASSRPEEWRRTLRALEPKVLKSGKDWQLLGPGEAQPGFSGSQARGSGDEALLLLLELQHEEAIRRLQLAEVPPGAVAALERQYTAARACLTQRFGASRLPAVLEEAQRNRAVLEALVYRLAGFPPARKTGTPP